MTEHHGSIHALWVQVTTHRYVLRSCNVSVKFDVIGNFSFFTI